MKKTCPKCGSDEHEEKIAHKYSMWGEFLSADTYIVCKKCGEELKEEERKENQQDQNY